MGSGAGPETGPDTAVHGEAAVCRDPQVAEADPHPWLCDARGSAPLWQGSEADFGVQVALRGFV